MGTTTKKQKTKEPTKRGAFSVCLQVNNKEYKADGDNLLECLENLKKPELLKTKSIFIIKRGKLTATKSLNIPQMRRLYGNTTTRSIFAKNLSMVLKYE